MASSAFASSSPLAVSVSSSPFDSPAPAPPFAYPGPSTRFHMRAKSRDSNILFPRTHTTPVAPNLSTATRAHRRHHSTNNVPVVAATRRPLAGPPPYLPRPSSMAGPLTPAKHSTSASTSALAMTQTRLQESPFSDYFSDEARSSPGDDPHPAVFTHETQQLLVRLSELQADLLRDTTGHRQTRRLVQRKIAELDRELNSTRSRTCTSVEMKDSTLFMVEDDDRTRDMKVTPESAEPQASVVPSSPIPDLRTLLTDPDAPSAQSGKADFILLEAQRVLDAVTKAHDVLRQHHHELKMTHTQCDQAIEHRDHEIDKLRGENHELRANLAFDQSDFLLLKLQFQAAEYQVKALESESTAAATVDSSCDDGFAESKVADMSRWARVSDKMGRLRNDLNAVSERMRSHRETYGLPSPTLSRGESSHEKQDDGNPCAIGETGNRGLKQSKDYMSLFGPDEEMSAHESSAGFSHEQEADSTVHESRTLASPDHVHTGTQTLSLLEIQSSVEHIVQTDFATEHAADEDSGSPLDEKTPTAMFFGDRNFPRRHQGEIHEFDDDDECAITTSSESEDIDEEETEDDVELDDEQATFRRPILSSQQSISSQNVKSAWQDLWEGLSSFAGLGDDRFD